MTVKLQTTRETLEKGAEQFKLYLSSLAARSKELPNGALLVELTDIQMFAESLGNVFDTCFPTGSGFGFCIDAVLTDPHDNGIDPDEDTPDELNMNPDAQNELGASVYEQSGLRLTYKPGDTQCGYTHDE